MSCLLNRSSILFFFLTFSAPLTVSYPRSGKVCTRLRKTASVCWRSTYRARARSCFPRLPSQTHGGFDKRHFVAFLRACCWWRDVVKRLVHYFHSGIILAKGKKVDRCAIVGSISRLRFARRIFGETRNIYAASFRPMEQRLGCEL